jgi:hypothetical protein
MIQRDLKNPNHQVATVDLGLPNLDLLAKAAHHGSTLQRSKLHIERRGDGLSLNQVGGKPVLR